LAKWGNSNLVLTAANTYTGPTTINAGRLVLPTGGTIVSTNITINTPGVFDVSASGYTLASGQTLKLNATNAVLGNLTVSSGATVMGNGTNNGNLTVNSGATLLPGASIGTLAVATNLTLSDGSLTYEL